MMIAEKAADLVLGNTPLPPAAVDFYRRDRAMPLERGEAAAPGD